MARHGEDSDNHGEREGPKEPAPKVFEFWILLRVERRYLRLEGHAANRAKAGTDLAYLRVHGTRINDARNYSASCRP